MSRFWRHSRHNSNQPPLIPPAYPGQSPYQAGPYQAPPYQAPAVYGAPIGADPSLWSLFSAVDQDQSGQISARELQRALTNDDWTNFDMETVNMLINMFDVDGNGTIGYSEFAELWRFIDSRKRVFRRFDNNNSGTIEASELRDALDSFGYTLAPELINLVMYKYATLRAMSHRGRSVLALTFDHFIRACMTIKALSHGFMELPRDDQGCVRMNYQTFLELALSAP